MEPGVLFHLLFCALDLVVPCGLVYYHFFDGETHARQDVRNTLEERSREDVDKSYLRLAKLDKVVTHRWAAEEA